MARSFAGITPKAYIGEPYDLPTQTRNSVFGRQQNLPPTAVTVSIPWIDYGASSSNPNILVNVNSMQFQGPRQSIDRIVSVRIDNLGNPVPVYVYFPDTAYTVVAPPFTVVWEWVQTGQFSAQIIGEGFATGQVGNTIVYFCNFFVPPSVNYEFEQSAALYLASATISRGNTIYNQNYGTPSLGDQISNVQANIGTAGQINNLFNTPSTGYIYLNSMFAYVNVYNVPVQVGVTLYLESTGPSGILIDLVASAQAVGVALVINPWIALYSMNLKLDATQQWRQRLTLSGTGGQAFINTSYVYTANPN